MPHRLPPSGKYRYSRNQEDRLMCQRFQKSDIPLARYGRLKFRSKSKAGIFEFQLPYPPQRNIHKSIILPTQSNPDWFTSTEINLSEITPRHLSVSKHEKNVLPHNIDRKMILL